MWKIDENRKAFTLIELLIVIGVIGVLSGVMFSVINVPEWRARAQDSVRKEAVATVAGALERYYSTNNTYPLTTEYPSSLNSTYITTLPQDPLGGHFSYTSTGQTFCLCASLRATNATPSVPAGCSAPYANSYCVTNPF